MTLQTKPPAHAFVAILSSKSWHLCHIMNVQARQGENAVEQKPAQQLAFWHTGYVLRLSLDKRLPNRTN